MGTDFIFRFKFSTLSANPGKDLCEKVNGKMTELRSIGWRACVCVDPCGAETACNNGDGLFTLPSRRFHLLMSSFLCKTKGVKSRVRHGAGFLGSLDKLGLCTESRLETRG